MNKFNFLLLLFISFLANTALANPDSIQQKIDYYISQAKFDSAKIYITTNLNDINQQKNISSLNYQLVKVLFIQSNYNEALKQAFNSLDQVDDKQQQVKLNFMIGCIYSAIKDYRKSIEYFDLVVEDSKDASLLVKTYLLSSELHLELNDSTNARKALTEAYKITNLSSSDNPLKNHVSIQYNFFSENYELCKQQNLEIIQDTSIFLNTKSYAFSMITSKEGAAKEITEEGKVINLIYGIDNKERATVLEIQRNYEQALKNGNFEILYSAFGRKKISGNYKIQSVYKTFGNVDITSQYQHMKPKSYFRFSLSSQARNIDSDDAYFVAKGKHDGKIYTIALFIHYNRTRWEGLKDNIFVLAQIVEQKYMETGQVSAASIEEKIKNEGKEVFHNILFDFGSDNLTQDSYSIIATLSKYLKTNPSQKYYIVGHTDNVGSLATNQTLSEKRAKAVLKALTNKYGIPLSQLSAHGIGQLSPLAINTTEEGRTLNRRVEIVLK
ncbi:MAG: OmpA family protein [Saprospiraceae bacterium]